MIYHTRKGVELDNYDLADLPETCLDAVRTLCKVQHRFDSIIVTGVSGLVVGPPVALALGVPLVVLRKEDDNSTHQWGGKYGDYKMVNAQNIGTRTLMLDDLISMGRTRARIKDAAQIAGAHLVGDYCYMSDQVSWYGG
jgi:adenine/guanine phosphoribosyltransferase-like PRPP-binding protein